MPAQGGFNLGAMTLGIAGGVLAYSGVRGKHISSVLRSLLAGNAPHGGAESGLGISLGKSGSDATDGTDDPPSGGSVGGSKTQNKAILKMVAAAHGWVGSEWTALDQLEMLEAGYDTEARNASSDAGGMPQALPVTKMSKEAQPKWAGGKGSATAQSQWMCNYIEERYEKPSVALSFHIQHNWY